MCMRLRDQLSSQRRAALLAPASVPLAVSAAFTSAVCGTVPAVCSLTVWCGLGASLLQRRLKTHSNKVNICLL